MALSFYTARKKFLSIIEWIFISRLNASETRCRQEMKKVRNHSGSSQNQFVLFRTEGRKPSLRGTHGGQREQMSSRTLLQMSRETLPKEMHADSKLHVKPTQPRDGRRRQRLTEWWWVRGWPRITLEVVTKGTKDKKHHRAPTKASQTSTVQVIREIKGSKQNLKNTYLLFPSYLYSFLSGCIMIWTKSSCLTKTKK